MGVAEGPQRGGTEKILLRPSGEHFLESLQSRNARLFKDVEYNAVSADCVTLCNSCGIPFLAMVANFFQKD